MFQSMNFTTERTEMPAKEKYQGGRHIKSFERYEFVLCVIENFTTEVHLLLVQLNVTFFYF